MKLRFTQRAVQDLVAISDYLRPLNPAGAQRVRTAILDSIKILTQFPGAGRLQDVESVRKLVTRKYPYRVYYRVNASSDEVLIITIQHSSRDPAFVDA
jgi:toxin ParE1/3/4